ncbi:hypothetical protein HPP_4560 [Hydrangea phyllody phytoplasma]|uniref:Uncharacterized protein n=2 Tax=16SrI (Aster yellows group) TaxID=3042590 RepID=A0ABQ5PTI0_9MOLU|nr:hypothetical protein [Hydrangea phyllody phytoplasma]GFZ75498.1 hypothetical protein HPP_4560 [Hydrangea phyllody phytoplasma]GLH61250.1 hypothetical protein RHYP_1950 [Rhus yellows phytoplasma]GLH62025.1 hypothetical protein HP2P_4320 [Hydrangea phyllody phytoplasma]GLH62138.1 hypothetical protein HP2P_5450 [Hydrangea phyllody phytoplasma]
MKDQFKNLDLDFLTAILTSSQMKSYFEGQSLGTTNRRSIKLEKFLATKIPYSTLTLKALNEKYKKISQKIKPLEKQVNVFKKELEKIVNEL